MPIHRSHDALMVRSKTFRQTATMGLGVATLPVLQTAGASLVSEVWNGTAGLDGEEDERPADDAQGEFARALGITESGEIDGIGTLGLDPENVIDDTASGSPGVMD